MQSIIIFDYLKKKKKKKKKKKFITKKGEGKNTIKKGKFHQFSF